MGGTHTHALHLTVVWWTYQYCGRGIAHTHMHWHLTVVVFWTFCTRIHTHDTHTTLDGFFFGPMMKFTIAIIVSLCKSYGPCRRCRFCHCVSPAICLGSCVTVVAVIINPPICYKTYTQSHNGIAYYTIHTQIAHFITRWGHAHCLGTREHHL